MKRGEVLVLRVFQTMMVVMGFVLAYGLVFTAVMLATGGVHSTACMEP